MASKAAKALGELRPSPSPSHPQGWSPPGEDGVTQLLPNCQGPCGQGDEVGLPPGTPSTPRSRDHPLPGCAPRQGWGKRGATPVLHPRPPARTQALPLPNPLTACLACRASPWQRRASSRSSRQRCSLLPTLSSELRHRDTRALSCSRYERRGRRALRGAPGAACPWPQSCQPPQLSPAATGCHQAQLAPQTKCTPTPCHSGPGITLARQSSSEAAVPVAWQSLPSSPGLRTGYTRSPRPSSPVWTGAIRAAAGLWGNGSMTRGWLRPLPRL